ncbi:hypothetical protein [Frigoribacterium sp. PhB118]|uniref:hypothetical protein n=1 Tax=Frigoribacterium sp. PhB118 TaxID=2485175 RepID=UPI000F4696E7|nr:hypothetical protein [Frigoribacterium sp. PhB118]ROS57205.1 hypothetical protein EDF21_0860 [Frigoribacterium sp. PhB118]
MADPKSKTADTNAQLPVDETPETEAASTELVGYAAYDVTEFEKRRAALELAITSNSADVVATAGTYLAFLSPEPEVTA